MFCFGPSQEWSFHHNHIDVPEHDIWIFLEIVFLDLRSDLALPKLRKISNNHFESCKAKKKNKSYVWKLPRAFVFQCAFDSAKFKVWIFLLAYFFFQVLWICLSKYTRKDMTDTMKHFEQQTSSTLCSVLYLVHPKSSSIFQSCERLKSDMSAAQKRKRKGKKTVKKKCI